MAEGNNNHNYNQEHELPTMEEFFDDEARILNWINESRRLNRKIELNREYAARGLSPFLNNDGVSRRMPIFEFDLQPPPKQRLGKFFVNDQEFDLFMNNLFDKLGLALESLKLLDIDQLEYILGRNNMESLLKLTTCTLLKSATKMPAELCWIILENLLGDDLNLAEDWASIIWHYLRCCLVKVPRLLTLTCSMQQLQLPPSLSQPHLLNKLPIGPFWLYKMLNQFTQNSTHENKTLQHQS